ncbi:MAG TPA: site-specific integrase [Phycisphaerae bacterium]|nr:site-specific integrase [Phycisphaerae bacterium]
MKRDDATGGLRLTQNSGSWCLEWHDRTGKRKRKSLGSLAKITRRRAEVMYRKALAEFTIRPGRRDLGTAPTLAEWETDYFDLRTDLGDGAKGLHRKTFEYLKARFGGDKRLDQISRLDAADWRAWLSRQGITETTVCGHARNAKQIGKYAMRADLIIENPFDWLKGTAPAPSKDFHQVTDLEVQAVLGACPRAAWKALIGLCYYAGLRRGEALRMEWRDVLWADRRLVVRAAGGVETTKARRREVRIEPELEKILLDAYDDGGNVGGVVIPQGGGLGHGPHRWMLRMIEAAGLKPWKAPYQTLRRARDMEWKKKYPAYVVNAWMGHSEAVSNRHYLAVPEQYYDRQQREIVDLTDLPPKVAAEIRRIISEHQQQEV